LRCSEGVKGLEGHLSEASLSREFSAKKGDPNRLLQGPLIAGIMTLLVLEAAMQLPMHTQYRAGPIKSEVNDSKEDFLGLLCQAREVRRSDLRSD
jgi:hypothetical protein